MSDLQTFKVHRDDPRSWRYMPEILDRLSKFCLNYDTETRPSDVVDLVRAWFCYGDSRLGLWVLLRDDAIAGHVFATPEPLGSEYVTYILIRQAEVDPGFDSRKECEQVFDELKRWAKSFGASRILQLTHRDTAAFYRRWGFEPFKVLMKLDLDSFPRLQPPDRILH